MFAPDLAGTWQRDGLPPAHSRAFLYDRVTKGLEDDSTIYHGGFSNSDASGPDEDLTADPTIDLHRVSIKGGWTLTYSCKDQVRSGQVCRALNFCLGSDKNSGACSPECSANASIDADPGSGGIKILVRTPFDRNDSSGCSHVAVSTRINSDLGASSPNFIADNPPH
jgi:hypothetical protein